MSEESGKPGPVRGRAVSLWCYLALQSARGVDLSRYQSVLVLVLLLLPLPLLEYRCLLLPVG